MRGERGEAEAQSETNVRQSKKSLQGGVMPEMSVDNS